MTAFTLEPVLKLRATNRVPLHFFVIGAGGTGGHLIPNLVRQIGIANKSLGDNLPAYRYHSITIVDQDQVEDKNLLRQNFTNNDLGKNKAEVMARRYGRAFGVPVGHIAKYITSPSELLLMVSDSFKAQRDMTIIRNRDKWQERMENETTQTDGYSEVLSYDYSQEAQLVLIDATDNNKTRLIIEEAGKIWPGNTVVLSSGNEKTGGQVVCSFLPANERDYRLSNVRFQNIKGLVHKSRLLRTPTFFELFPTSDLEKLPTEISCAEATVSAPQNMIANTTAANILFNFANKLIANEYISTFLIFFDTEGMSQKTYRFTQSDIFDAMHLTPANAHRQEFLTSTAFARCENTSLIDAVSKPTWRDALVAAEAENAKKAESLEEVLSALAR